MVYCVKGKIVFNHATVAFQKSLSLSNVRWLFEGRKVVPFALESCLFKWLPCVKCLFLWVTIRNCLLPFPVVFNESNEEKSFRTGLLPIPIALENPSL